MKNQTKQEKETPSISIEEALRLYLSAAVPNGLPEDIDTDLLFSRLKAYIAKDRPEWAGKFEAGSGLSSKEIQKSYSRIKQEIIEKAMKEEVPEDTEERYLYERRKEARQNSQAKKEESRISEKQDKLVKDLVQRKKEEEKEKQQKIEFIKNELKKKLSQAFKNNFPGISNLEHQKQNLGRPENKIESTQNLSLETSANLTTKYSQEKIKKWNQIRWNPEKSLINRKIFKEMDLSEKQKDKLVALDTFHEMRRQNMYKRSEVVKPLNFENAYKSRREGIIELDQNDRFENNVGFNRIKEQNSALQINSNDKIAGGLEFKNNDKIIKEPQIKRNVRNLNAGNIQPVAKNKLEKQGLFPVENNVDFDEVKEKNIALQINNNEKSTGRPEFKNDDKIFLEQQIKRNTGYLNTDEIQQETKNKLEKQGPFPVENRQKKDKSSNFQIDRIDHAKREIPGNKKKKPGSNILYNKKRKKKDTLFVDFAGKRGKATVPLPEKKHEKPEMEMSMDMNMDMSFTGKKQKGFNLEL